MDSNLLERSRQLAYNDSGNLSNEKAQTVQDLLFYLAELEKYIAELEGLVNLRSFCPYCGKGLTQPNS
jgi:hypothetical protein